MKYSLLVLLPFIFQGQLLCGQSIRQTDSIVKLYMDSAAVTGICIGVIRDNKILYTRAYGYRIKETITGKSLEDLAKEMVFIPLGMSRTGYIWHDDFESDYALGYDQKGDSIT